jgi:hypothetical protein
MAAKVDGIPEDHLITPPASIAVPALMGLSYTFEEASLKELYLNLLTTASDDRKANQAHPAFAEIINQLSADEAPVLNTVLNGQLGVALTAVRVFTTIEDGYKLILVSHLFHLETSEGLPDEYDQISTWADNWQRLGLVSIGYGDREVGGKTAYDWAEKRPEYIRLTMDPSITNLWFEKGALLVTDFGLQFFRAVN